MCTMHADRQAVIALPRLSVSLVDTQAGFNRLEGVWNKLLLASPRPVPFLTWEWVSTWWKHFHGNSRLFVLVARDENQDVVGLAPLKIVVRRGFGLVPVRTVEFLGYRGSAVCPDHLDFLSIKENGAAIMKMLVQGILARSDEWDSIVLADLAEGSLLPTAAARECAEEGLTLMTTPQEVCPCVGLASDWQSFLLLMKSRHIRVRNIKRRRGLLAQQFTVRFSVEISAENLHSRLGLLARFSERSRRHKKTPSNFSHKEYRDFQHEVAEHMSQAGWLYLAELDCDEQPVALGYGFHMGDVLFYYQTAYDTRFAALGVGEALHGMVIQDAIERLHAVEVDWLRGSEEYKYRWTRQERHTFTVLTWGKMLRGAIGRSEFLLRRRLSPWKQRLRILWESAGQRWRSVNGNRAGATAEE